MPEIVFYLHTYTGRTLHKCLIIIHIQRFVYMMHVFYKKIFFFIYYIIVYSIVVVVVIG